MKRRAVVALLGGVVVGWPLAARAQQSPALRRIGVLMGLSNSDPTGQRYLASFIRGLQELGWIEGRNIRIDYRWVADDTERIRASAEELVNLKPDVILAHSGLTVAQLQRQTSTIPIVFLHIVDPVATGFVRTLARPGGNITGFTPGELSLTGKLVEILKELAPRLNRVAIIYNPAQAPQLGMLRALEASTLALGLAAIPSAIRDAAEIESAVNALAGEPGTGVVVLANPITNRHRSLILQLVADRRLPTIYPFRYFAEEGGLMSYGVDATGQFYQAASYVDLIMKGSKPADLPVQQPTKFELVINLKTAKALGLTVPPTLLARADEVIE
jgi:putative tryptophan/tyrosine transport system substrate-binding protein